MSYASSLTLDSIQIKAYLHVLLQRSHSTRPYLITQKKLDCIHLLYLYSNFIIPSGHPKRFTHSPIHTHTHIFTHSYTHTFTHTHIHTPTAVASAMQSDSQLVRSSQGEGVLLRDTSTLELGGAGDRTGNLAVTSRPSLLPELPYLTVKQSNTSRTF